MAATHPPRVLTIAGSDSGGGAGIEADLKTFTILQTYGMAAITSVTAQNTQGVFGVHDLPPDMVASQIDVVANDMGFDAVKSGMLSNAGIIEVVASALMRHNNENYVLDPVMVSESGHALLQRDAVKTLIDKLIPLARVVTPNVSESEVLCGVRVTDEASMRRAAEAIHGLGARAVLVKGGHLSGEEATDLLYDGAAFVTVSAPRLETRNTHGTGCTYSAAIAAMLARGVELTEAVHAGKRYVTEAIRHGFELGHGPGPLNHYWPLH